MDITLNRQKIEPLLKFLRKKATFLSFCLIVALVLVGGVFLIRFLSNILISIQVDETAIQVQKLTVNMRLYREVVAKMDQDQSQPIRGIGDLTNPFR